MEKVQVHRDIQCAQSVAAMAKLRRFDLEHTAYGCVEIMSDGALVYHGVDDAEKLYEHVEKRKTQGSYFTVLSETKRRCTVPSGYEEVLKQAVKYTLLSEMKASYTAVNFFEEMKPYFLLPPNDAAYTSLKQYQDEIEGYFDNERLSLFWGLVGIAYESKILSKQRLNSDK